ncbi:MAG: DUF262 domain-containing protein [Bacteroidales bacterium]|nr:DUF262 domain-containing protein [Bacteroidales bacterium]
MASLILPSICAAPLNLDKIIGKDSAYTVSDADGRTVLHFQIEDNVLKLENDIPLTEPEKEALITEARAISESEASGIEQETESDTGIQPFDPKEIALISKVITMETVIRRIEQGTIQLDPNFQRKEVWDIERKSRLIESLMLKIPIPMFYVSSDANDNWIVVDGLQRLSTMRDFILGEDYMKTKKIELKGHGFKLQDLEFWRDYNGFDFASLPPKLLNRILETEFNFTIINPPTPEDVKLNIFKRINTGGMQLSQQEIRNALYNGPSTELLNRLAASQAFIKATDHSIHADRMQDKELILRFLSFLIRDYASYQKTLVADQWLSQTMLILNNYGHYDDPKFLKFADKNRISLAGLTPMNPDEIAVKFEVAMARASKLFGRHAFRKSYGAMKRSPINKSLFEVWSNILQSLTEEQFDILYKNRKEFYSGYQRILDNPTFIIAISRDSMKWQSVKRRYEDLSNLCQSIIQQHQPCHAPCMN